MYSVISLFVIKKIPVIVNDFFSEWQHKLTESYIFGNIRQNNIRKAATLENVTSGVPNGSFAAFDDFDSKDPMAIIGC